MFHELTLVAVLEQLKRLHVAFPSHSGMRSNPEGTARVYRDELHGLSSEALRAAASVVIQSDNFFPKVSRLRELAHEWQRRRQVHLVTDTTDALWCPNCQTLAIDRTRYRPMVYNEPHEKAGYVMRSDDGVWIYLEAYTRLLCECASPCAYAPDPDAEYLAMRADQVKWLCGRQDRPRRTLMLVDHA